MELARAECPHNDFNAFADIGRISAVEGGPIIYYSCDLKIICRDCGQPLEFVGLPHGLSAYQPTVSIDEQSARLPMVIPGKFVPAGLPGFGVRVTVADQKQEPVQ